MQRSECVSTLLHVHDLTCFVYSLGPSISFHLSSMDKCTYTVLYYYYYYYYRHNKTSEIILSMPLFHLQVLQ